MTVSAESKVRSVPFFNYKIFQEQYGDELVNVLKDVVDRGAFIMQSDLDQLEKAMAEYLGVKYAFGVANCTDGLIIALRAAGVKPGDEVILPAHTFIATAASIHFVGAKPVPVECGTDHMMDPESFEKAITDKTTAVMPVQLNGRTCDMESIMTIAKQHDLAVIEDAAQALGSSFKGKHAGTFGAAAAFSFYPAKVLGCLGDGGLVVTNDDDMAAKMYQLRDHGRDFTGKVVSWGGNSRLDNIQAAVLNLLFKDYPAVIERRREIASLYQAALGGMNNLHLPPAPDADSDHFDVYQNYEIEADQRDELQAFLRERGIGTLIQWDGKAVHQFEDLNFDCNLPVTDKMTTRYIMLPMNMSISNDDVEYVCENIREFYIKG